LETLRARLQARILDPALRRLWIPTAPAARRRVLDATCHLAGERDESVDLMTAAGDRGLTVEESARLAPGSVVFSEAPGSLLLYGITASQLSMALLLAGAALRPGMPVTLHPRPLCQDPFCFALALDLFAPAAMLQRLRALKVPAPSDLAA
jgi:hypothetical protein